uniref:Arrestin C-terminal-like domain-containing protein n=1 Tax=Pseudictyota dubia TaxID=2749911 RepID=A0A7R9W0F7_9STRA|mmetsp:Transcript_27516/g.51135  ORF Transcript_27516/g.51135 Transcript_27516/m.51135 type:complete len:432 (+) Transcript_27516:36-1331(+)
MGNKPCTIALRTDRATYVAGSTIAGTVYLCVAGKAQQGSSLNLRIVGEESATVHHTTEERQHGRGEGHRHSETRHHYERSSFAFLSADYPISTFPNGGIPPGQYEFPFEAALPPDLPASMRCEKGQSMCRVSYSMTAQIVDSGSFLGSSKPSASRDFCVVASSPPLRHLEGTEIVVPPETIPVSTCCCFGRGSMTIGAQIDKSALRPTEMVKVGFFCKNNSTVKVANVKVSLEEEVTWRANGHTESFCKTADERLLGGAERMPELRETGRAKHRHLGFQGGYGHLSTPEQPQREACLVVPPNSKDTYEGRLIDVKHRIIVMIMTTGGCCTTSPETYVSVSVRRCPPETVDGGEGSGELPLPNQSIQAFVAPPATGSSPLPSAPPREHQVNDLPEAELILPGKWSAQTADVVTVPVVEATVLDSIPKGGVHT